MKSNKYLLVVVDYDSETLEVHHLEDEGEVYEQREKAERQYTGDDAYRCGQGIGLRKAGQDGAEKRETDQTGTDGVERLHAVVVV